MQGEHFPLDLTDILTPVGQLMNLSAGPSTQSLSTPTSNSLQ
jgi:hypothetical protein